MKKALSTLLSLFMIITALTPFSALAGTVITMKTEINVLSAQATVVQSSTIYVGEITVDGVTQMRYVYSEDVTRGCMELVANCFSGYGKPEIAELIASDSSDKETGISVCSNSEFSDKMDDSWKDAGKTASACYPDYLLVSSADVDLYATDTDFVEAYNTNKPDALENAVIKDYSNNDYISKGILLPFVINSSDSVYYTTDDGILKKHINRDYDSTCEDAAVIYTKAELSSNKSGDTQAPSANILSTVTPVQATAVNEKALNTLSVKAKKPTLKYSKLKKSNQTVAAKNAMTVSNAQGEVTYALSSAKKGKKSFKKKFKLNANTGKLTVKKGLKKGTYKLKIKVTAAGDSDYKAATKILTVTIKVK